MALIKKKTMYTSLYAHRFTDISLENLATFRMLEDSHKMPVTPTELYIMGVFEEKTQAEQYVDTFYKRVVVVLGYNNLISRSVAFGTYTEWVVSFAPIFYDDYAEKWCVILVATDTHILLEYMDDVERLVEDTVEKAAKKAFKWFDKNPEKAIEEARSCLFKTYTEDN